MEESAMKELNGNSMNCKICVKGYPTWLREFDLKMVLRKHLASCGEITHVYIPRDFERGILKRCAYISIRGEGAEEKALELNGSDVGGWTVIVSKAPRSHKENIDPGWATLEEAPSHQIIVTGYDTSLPEDDIMIGLSKYFSSCGDIHDILLLKSRAAISIMGEDAIEKAQALSGSEVEGWKIDVVMVIPACGTEYHDGQMVCYSLPIEARMRMTKV